ncbi:hypothetical protein H7849_19605 [Alloacidobacterium dinghuense]|uniref:Cytochrome c-552/4 domain-containing protein n=1 Tax=Alloacidobacterium dinghuense TaxID=2763107 RepID=A0A7G8BFF5_9BACT|nr:multiheme c-type cytochrome [Alloacidobacterium dinghuense]QNI31275.1 hypothetical protein H7849_19605 [Alloacidobacterium dinghuense]
MYRVLAIIIALELTASNMAPGWHSPLAAAQAASSAKSNERANYVGDSACQSCHGDKVGTFHQTAHYLTSSAPDSKSILGSFTPDANILKTSNPSLFFRMDDKDTGFFQTAVAGTPPHTNERTERFAVVVGSGDKGQTYLYWNDDQLFQLPVSYWKDLGWVNSPGYRDGFANFDRAIIPRCLECHATYFAALPPPSNRYRTTGFSLGITCEKCHGPGREHVELETAKPGSGTSSAILNPAQFTRERQMDLCAWCHAGHGRPLLPTFSYLPNNPLEKYLDLPPPDPNAPLDVHGNQVELLKRSRCFISSSMTCLTCHDVHRTQHDLAEFSQKCLGCHKPDSATFSKSNHPVTSNCIDCHMPKQETNLIVFNWNGKTLKPQMRSHLIKAYSAAGTPASNQ